MKIEPKHNVRLQKKVVSLLSKGNTLVEISKILKEENFQPNSLSAIEKLINSLKKKYRAKSTFQLGYKIAKEEAKISLLKKLNGGNLQ